MSREWANELADKFENAEILWTKNTMVATCDGKPSFCMLGAIAKECGVGVFADDFGGPEGEDIWYRIRAGDLVRNTCYEERSRDLGSYLRAQERFGCDQFDDDEVHIQVLRDYIASLNDKVETTLPDVVAKLREFANEQAVGE